MTSTTGKHRIGRMNSVSIEPWRSEELHFNGEPLPDAASVDCGWGKLIFAHTFKSNEDLVAAIKDEKEGRRNLALYLRDPHVVLAMAPQELFLDPSHTYRLSLGQYLPGRVRPVGFSVRRIQKRADADEIHRVLASCRMVSPSPEFIWSNRSSRSLQFFVAEETGTGRALGTVMGVDHAEAFGDPENGSSMWCLAVDPQAPQPGIGRALAAHIADHFAARGRAFMDLSVMHDNVGVIRLYEDLGFKRVPAFCVKRRNAINRDLYLGQQPDTDLNPYAKIIVDEAQRRGIAVDVVDAEHGYFALQNAGRRVLCRESLSELTSAVAMSRCDNKIVTHRALRSVGVSLPAQMRAGERAENEAFLERHGAVVVKPARGEQGRGVSVDIDDAEDLEEAVQRAKALCEDVVIEEYATGSDLRVVLIDFEVVAAALRKPAAVVGNGRHSVRELIEKQSRRRSAATGGESSIPVDAETARCVSKQGLGLDDVVPEGTELRVRETANLHTGGTLHDVTDQLHPTLAAVSRKIAQTLDIPVVGLDFIVDDASKERYVFIEANERPGLANHEPRPTAARFVDLLFPETASSAAA
ncbi:MAG: N-acetylglutaminylglutamine synthetase [Gammaproteobacteria bacterium]|nr:N-acetylglutaminylglutamine synthetase [Gammaproteobacteria bacterium]